MNKYRWKTCNKCKGRKHLVEDLETGDIEIKVPSRCNNKEGCENQIIKDGGLYDCK